MKDYKILLFDLDGTISDPKVGITKSVQYALEKTGIIESDMDELECFIGPPLHVSFSEFYQLNERQTEKAIEFYRERFKAKGMFENTLYKKIPELLKSLQKQGYTLTIATSKPTVFAEKILNYFQIDHYFDHGVGSNLKGTRSAKNEIISYILNQHPENNLSDFLMIGDRKHDIIGANQTGIDSLAVTYGYGSKEELLEVSPTYIVDEVQQIKEIIVNKKYT